MRSNDYTNPEMTIDEAFNPELIMDEVIEPEIINEDDSTSNRILVVDNGTSSKKHLSQILTTLAAVSSSTSFLPIEDVFRKVGFRPKPYIEPKKCLNPNCEKITDHKRGYCSKDCLLNHKLLTKGK